MALPGTPTQTNGGREIDGATCTSVMASNSSDGEVFDLLAEFASGAVLITNGDDISAAIRSA